MIVQDKKICKGTYFDLRRFIKLYPKESCYIVIGARGIGKTTTMKLFFKSTYEKAKQEVENKTWDELDIKKGKLDVLKDKFVWLNRTNEEVILKANETFNDLGWIAIGNNICWPIEVNVKATNKKGEEVEELRQVMLIVGQFQALNNSSKMRGGNNYDDFAYIVWDEFMDEEGKYLPNETKKFQSILQTVSRTKTHTKVFLFSNAVEKDAPILKLFNFDPDAIETEQQAYYPERGTVIYKATPSEDLKKKMENSVFAKIVGKNSEYLDYSINNTFLIEDNDMILRTPDPRWILKPVYNCVYLRYKFGVYNYGANCLYFKWDTIENGRTYGLSKQDCVENKLDIREHDNLYYRWNIMIKSGRIFFEDPTLKELITSLLAKKIR